MSAIIAIILFLIFITYGISEHKLVVSLHNIRVFFSRMCNGITGIFANKNSNMPDWDESNQPSKTRMEYRSFNEKERNTREQNLLEQVRKLENERTTQQHKLRELSAQYNESLHKLSNQVKSCESTINDLKIENDEYKERLNGLLPIDKYRIAHPFCLEYEQIISITNRLIGRLIIEFESLPDRQKKQCYPFFIDLVYDKQDEEDNSVTRWYSLLKDVALVPKELSFDLTSKNGENSKLEYLQKYAFEKFYRKHIASAVLFAENIRISVSAQERRKAILGAINELIDSLLPYGISVDYIPINTILSDADFSKYEIESVTNETEEENKILLVRKYAVNRSNVNAETEKTMLVINI